jgi:hypothetical protein
MTCFGRIGPASGVLMAKMFIYIYNILYINYGETAAKDIYV